MFMFNADEADSSSLSVQEYDVGQDPATSNEIEPITTANTVDSQIADDPFEEGDIGHLFSENDAEEGNKYVEFLDIEPIDDIDALAASIKEDPLNLTMLRVSLDNDGIDESNASDCVVTAAYYMYDEEDGDTDAK